MAITAKWTDFSSLDGEQIISMVNRRLPAIVTLLLVLLLGWQLARVVWMLVPGSGDPVTATPPPDVSSTSATADTRADVERIAAAHLFGEASADTAPVAPVETPAEELEETRLALTLKGTMAGSDNRLTAAIIADNRNEEKVYTIGDAVAAGATLHAVYRDQVVLNRSGVLESLKLPKEMPKSSAPIRPAETTRTTAQTTESPSIQNALTQNAAKLADVIRPTPYFEAGQQQGYRVYPGRDRRAFAALGLRPGDLIKDIDGAALTDPQQAMEIFQNLGTADQVSVTVERNGQPQVLTLTTSQLQLDDEDDQN
jgi:general secretion pathway protein C